MRNRVWRGAVSTIWQSESQLEDVWGREGAKTMRDTVSWRSYNAIQDGDVAELGQVVTSDVAVEVVVGVDRVEADRALDQQLRLLHRVDDPFREAAPGVDHGVRVVHRRDQVVLAVVRVHRQLGVDRAQLAPLGLG